MHSLDHEFQQQDVASLSPQFSPIAAGKSSNESKQTLGRFVDYLNSMGVAFINETSDFADALGLMSPRPVHTKDDLIEHFLQTEMMYSTREPSTRELSTRESETLSTTPLKTTRTKVPKRPPKRPDQPPPSRLCRQASCKKRPSYGYDGCQPHYCSTHKGEGMVDVAHRGRCGEEGCTTQPAYGYPGGKERYCTLHKGPGMHDFKRSKGLRLPVPPKGSVSDQGGQGVLGGSGEGLLPSPGPLKATRRPQSCEVQQCLRRATWAASGQPAARCVVHRGETDVYVKHMCGEPGCSKVAGFSFPGERPAFCAAHRAPGMVDVKSKTCSIPGCGQRSSFALPGQAARYCSKHRDPGSMVDVVHRQCSRQGCGKNPTYGYPGGERQSCARHKAEHMVDLNKRLKRSQAAQQPECHAHFADDLEVPHHDPALEDASLAHLDVHTQHLLHHHGGDDGVEDHDLQPHLGDPEELLGHSGDEATADMLMMAASMQADPL